MTKYTAIIIEPRKHLALSFVLKNFNEHLEKEWSFIIFHGTKNKEYVENIIDTVFIENKSRFRLVNLHVENLYRNEYDDLLKQKSIVYDHIQTETFLIFQADTLILKENKHLINDFLEYDYVGAPWQDGVVGNGGLSLRKKSKMIEIINTIKIENGKLNEDEYFCRQNEIELYTPSFEKAKKFSVETIFYESPFGVHNCYHYLSQIEWDLLINNYPELSNLKELNIIKKSPRETRFTIVYKTYKNDLKLLEYSLESLKKYLDPINIFEIIIYAHDVVYCEVLKLLDEKQLKHLIPFRVLPVAYNYHGYIKQMVVKANCYKDVQTEYVVILDPDLLLQKYLDVEWLIQEDGKIEWEYLKIEDDPSNPVFSVWKKACEDSNHTEKKIHYMSKRFPFVFTRKSLEAAANKFIEMHGRDYDSYCYVRCFEQKIDVGETFENQFLKLCKIFLFIDYLGFFCHHYSNDYIFTAIPYCDKELFFIQEKSSIKNIKINELLDKNNKNRKFTIVYKTYKNDLQWLEYSLESLKKYLYPLNVFEIIIYTHDVVYGEVLQLLEKLQMKQFIPFRVLPVAYNYHGYIKQMAVKANCYKDVRTDYVVLLDSDLLLQKYLDMEWLIREDGKIEWKYLKIEDDPTNSVFSVWKKACEDSTHIEKKIHYMSNGFPFVFTRKSLEAAANKFIEMNGRDYNSYCYVRCCDENINVDSSTTSIFNILSKIFTEFEYLGFFCHYYSPDYIFTTTPRCRMELQSGEIENNNSYFIQYWSYGEKTDTIINRINKILKK